MKAPAKRKTNITPRSYRYGKSGSKASARSLFASSVDGQCSHESEELQPGANVVVNFGGVEIGRGMFINKENDMYGQVVLLENNFNKRKDLDEVNLQKPVGDKLTFHELKKHDVFQWKLSNLNHVKALGQSNNRTSDGTPEPGSVSESESMSEYENNRSRNVAYNSEVWKQISEGNISLSEDGNLVFSEERSLNSQETPKKTITTVKKSAAKKTLSPNKKSTAPRKSTGVCSRKSKAVHPKKRTSPYKKCAVASPKITSSSTKKNTTSPKKMEKTAVSLKKSRKNIAVSRSLKMTHENRSLKGASTKKTSLPEEITVNQEGEAVVGPSKKKSKFWKYVNDSASHGPCADIFQSPSESELSSTGRGKRAKRQKVNHQ